MHTKSTNLSRLVLHCIHNKYNIFVFEHVKCYNCLHDNLET